MKKYIIWALKGAAYGVTNIVPGIGGGTVLILLGIYEQFVDAFGNLLNWRRWKDIMPFLTILLGGAAVGMIALSKLINMLLDRYEAATIFFFIGLLVATIPSVIKMHYNMRLTVKRAIAFVIGVAIVVVLRFMREQILEAPGRADANVEIANLGGAIYYVVTSFLAGGASVTPGMDGSFVFMLAGTYKPITGALSALAKLDIRWLVIICTALGAAPGIILFSKLITWGIKRWPSAIYYGVLGIIIGSIYGLWPTRSLPQANIPVVVIVFIIGLILGLLSGKLNEVESRT